VAVQRIEGVLDAEFSYERSEGIVTYDPERTSVEAIIAELTRMTGYAATVRDGSEPPRHEHE